jgi:integrase
MSGSIRRRGPNSWQLRIYVGMDPQNSRQRWVTRTVRGSERAARRELVRFADEASYTRVHAGTLADLLDRWFETASGDWAASTKRETRSLVEHHLKPHLGHLPVAKVTTADIDGFYAYLRRCGGRMSHPLAAGTVHRVHVVLHRALAQAVRWEWIWLNPASHASPPRYVPAEIRPPSAGEVADLVAHASNVNPSLGLFFLLAATTGARRGELLALRWRDVDLEEGSLAFQRSLVEGLDGPVLAPTKTRRSHRVALDASSVEALKAQLKRAATPAPATELADRFVFSLKPDGMIPWRPNWVTKAFIRCRTEAGLPHFRLHDLRHFMATEMLDGGVPIAVVSGRLAHARASTTLNVYAHAIPGGDRAAAQQLSERLKRAAPGRFAMRVSPEHGSRI